MTLLKREPINTKTNRINNSIVVDLIVGDFISKIIRFLCHDSNSFAFERISFFLRALFNSLALSLSFDSNRSGTFLIAFLDPSHLFMAIKIKPCFCGTFWVLYRSFIRAHIVLVVWNEKENHARIQKTTPDKIIESNKRRARIARVAGRVNTRFYVLLTLVLMLIPSVHIHRTHNASALPTSPSYVINPSRFSRMFNENDIIFLVAFSACFFFCIFQLSLYI